MKRHENLRQLQQALLRDMLTTDPTTGQSPWKVLVMDEFVQRLLSPVLRVADLRELGVTLHLQLHAKRERIADVPAVYFCEPTSGNVRRICGDVNSRQYGQYRLHFTTSISRARMEELAQCTRMHADCIQKVADEYMSFECVESRLFTVPLSDDFDGDGDGDGGATSTSSRPTLFKMLMSPSVSDKQIEWALDRQAVGLLSVCVAVGGQPPIVAAMRGGTAETVASKLDAKLRDLMASVKAKSLGPSQLHDDLGLQRPVLIVVDRAADISTPLRHSASYAALVQDVFGMEHNRCQVPVDAPGPTGNKITFSVDPRDPLWSQHAESPFPDAAEAVDAAVRQYKADYDAINAASGSTGATDLRNAISVLPELTDRKRVIDQHLSVCQALLTAIKERHLGDLFAVEQRLERGAVLSFLDGREGLSEDKCRLYVIYLVHLMQSKGQVEAFERDCRGFLDALPATYKDKLAAVKQHVHLQCALSSTPASPRHLPLAPPPHLEHSPAADADSWSRLSRVSGGLLSGLATGVKSLMANAGDTGDFVLVKACKSILDHLLVSSSSPPPSPLDYAVHDPLSPHSPPTVGRSAVNHVIVFVVGGVSRPEYTAICGSLRQYGMVTVGGSAVVSGRDILDCF